MTTTHDESEFMKEVRDVLDANCEPAYAEAKDQIRAMLKGATYDSHFNICAGMTYSVMNYVKYKLSDEGFTVVLIDTAPDRYFLTVKVPTRREGVV